MAAVVVKQDGFIGPRATGQGAQDATTPITAARLAAVVAGLTEQRAGELLPVANEMIEKYAPAAPEAVKAEAIVRLAGWLFHRVPRAMERVQIGQISLDFRPYLRATPAALNHSGAASLLSPWRVRRAGAIG